MTARYRSRARGLALAVAGLIAAFAGARAAPARAESALDGELAVQNATAAFNQGVIEVSAQVRYPLTERIRAALRDGVTLAFDLDIDISRPRSLWWDADVVSLTLRRELSYHVITERYVVRDGEDVELASYPTAEAALEDLGEVERYPVAVESQMGGVGPWKVHVRAGVRRGRMPDALRAIAFWTDDWRRTSGWYSWNLER